MTLDNIGFDVRVHLCHRMVLRMNFGQSGKPNAIPVIPKVLSLSDIVKVKGGNKLFQI